MTIDYKNSKVYKIWSPNGDKIYVGSTTKIMLCQRMTAHRYNYRLWKETGKADTTSYILFDEYGLENCFIELLEAKECNSKDELHKLEGKFIRELNCVNKIVAGRTKQEYFEDNKEHLIEWGNNWRKDNKEYITDYSNKYRSDNKETIKTKKSIPYTCTCGSTFRKDEKARHERSIKHKSFLENSIEQ